MIRIEFPRGDLTPDVIIKDSQGVTVSSGEAVLIGISTNGMFWYGYSFSGTPGAEYNIIIDGGDTIEDIEHRYVNFWATEEYSPADIASQVETAIITEGDGKQVLQAIADKIGNENVNAGIIATTVRTEIERSGGMLDYIATASGEVSSGGLTSIQEEKLNEIHANIDVKLSSRASIRSVSNMSSGSGGLTKEESKMLNTLVKNTKDIKDKVEKMHDSIDSMNTKNDKDIDTLIGIVQSVQDYGKSISDFGKSTLDAVTEIANKDIHSPINAVKELVIQSISQTEENINKLAMILSNSDAESMKKIALLFQDGVSDIKTAIQMEKKDASITYTERMNIIHKSLDSFNEKLEAFSEKQLVFHIEADE